MCSRSSMEPSSYICLIHFRASRSLYTSCTAFYLTYTSCGSVNYMCDFCSKEKISQWRNRLQKLLLRLLSSNKLHAFSGFYCLDVICKVILRQIQISFPPVGAEKIIHTNCLNDSSTLNAIPGTASANCCLVICPRR